LYAVAELPDFLAAISATVEPKRALLNGISRIAETFDAEVVAVVDGGEVIACVGYPEDEPVDAGVVAVATEATSTVEISGVGQASAVAIDLTEAGCVLIIARASEPLTNLELAHARAMARILALAMSLVDKIDENERLLVEQRQLLDEQRVQRAIQEAILRVQRLISQRQPIETILQAITTEAAFLLRADLAGIYLHTVQGPAQHCLAAGTEAGRQLAETLPESELLAIGQQASWSDITEPRTVSAETLDGDEVEATILGAPVFDDGTLIGGLFVVSADDREGRWEADTAPLETFASQASIALTDASTISELEHAFHDHLTGLPNRALFQDRFEHALDLAERMDTTTGLLFLDLDRFKSVNDTLGHAAGDALLQDVARVLQNGGRSYDSVARLGGDEFGIVLEDTSAEAAETVAQRLLERVDRVINPSGSQGQPGVSIGIALSDPDCRTTDELLRRADIAMYAAKSSGRAGFACYDATMGQTRLDQSALAEALQLALVRDDFVVHYQPIVSLQSRQITGVEALVRWQDPDRGLIGPAGFIDAAEASGMIVPIGRRVLDIACRQAAIWRRTIPSAADLQLSVNLSVRQLEHDNIESDVGEAIAASELDPAALTLEVTESVFVNNAADASTTLHALKDLGIRLAIDDFGTGYSSLGYIHNYPFDVLKIDRSFVKGIGSSSNSGAVVRTMLALAKQLSMATVAEGIESQAELAQLRALRCSHGQGFLFARPVSAQELERLLLTGSRALATSAP